MKWSEQINEIAKALNACQKELKDVFKNADGYGYKYAPLDKVYDEVRPKMTKHGLSLTHSKSFNRETNTIELRSLLMHESGQWIEYHGSLPFASMKGMNDYQSAGSGFTYLERYQTSTIFGITSDEDNDAQGDQQEPTITDDQAATLDHEIGAAGVDRNKFLQFFGIGDLSELPASRYGQAMKMIQKKKKVAA